MTIDRGISAPFHDREFLDSLNATEKRFIFHLMETVQLTRSQHIYTQIEIHTSTQTSNIILSQEFQNHFSNASHQHGILDHGNHKKVQVTKEWKKRYYHV